LPLKLIGQKKVHHKIEIAFNFTEEIPLKITWNKKKLTLKQLRKIPSTTMKLIYM